MAVKLGLIGCGRIAQLVHLGILAEMPGVDLVGIAENDPEQRAEAARRAPTVPLFDDYHDLLRVDEMDAVVICLPPSLHAAATVAALEAGRHVYLEKPLATNLEDGHWVLEAWRVSQLVGMIGFNYRFNPLFQALRRELRAGMVGEVVGARSSFSTPTRVLPHWKSRKALGGGALLDLASHHIDLVHFLFEQDVREVSAQDRSQRSEGDSAVLSLRLVDGTLVQSFFSLCAVDEDRFEVYGRAGKLAVDRHRSLDLERVGPTPERAGVKRLFNGLHDLPPVRRLAHKLLAPGYEPSYGASLAEFIACVHTGRAGRPDFLDGYRSLEVLIAAEKSIAACKPVELRFAREPAHA